MSAVFTVQPTPSPWSARQAHVWSMIVWFVLTTRLWVALPTCSPPMRKNTSCTAVGLLALLRRGFFVLPSSVEILVPSWRSAGEFTVPASNMRPAMSMPGTSSVCMPITPLSGTIVARPMPSTTVFG